MHGSPGACSARAVVPSSLTRALPAASFISVSAAPLVTGLRRVPLSSRFSVTWQLRAWSREPPRLSRDSGRAAHLVASGPVSVHRGGALQPFRKGAEPGCRAPGIVGLARSQQRQGPEPTPQPATHTRCGCEGSGGCQALGTAPGTWRELRVWTVVMSPVSP